MNARGWVITYGVTWTEMPAKRKVLMFHAKHGCHSQTLVKWRRADKGRSERKINRDKARIRFRERCTTGQLNTHKQTRTHVFARMPMHMHAQAHTDICMCAHTQTRSRTSLCAHTHIYALKNTRIKLR